MKMKDKIKFPLYSYLGNKKEKKHITSKNKTSCNNKVDAIAFIKLFDNRQTIKYFLKILLEHPKDKSAQFQYNKK